jgi:hypothetical protein
MTTDPGEAYRQLYTQHTDRASIAALAADRTLDPKARAQAWKLLDFIDKTGGAPAHSAIVVLSELPPT